MIKIGISFQFVLVLGLLFTNFAQGKKMEQVSQESENLALAQYFNSFETIGALIENLRFVSIITKKESEDIIEILKNNSISLSQNPAQTRSEKSKLIFGKTAALVMGTDGRTKNQDGRFIAIQKQMSFVEVFSKTMEVQLGKKISSRYSVILSPAFANSVELVDAATSSLGLGFKHIAALFYGDLGQPLIASILAGGSSVIRGLIWPLR